LPLPPQRRRTIARAFGWGPIAAFVAISGALVALILVVRADSYWNLSDGAYLYTSDAVLHGAGLYTDVAAAQPPLLYFLGAAALSAGDEWWSFRTLLALVDVVTAATVLVAVYRLTGRRRLAVAAGVLGLLTPRALHDFANLLPETFGAPLLMGAALLVTRRTTAIAAGAAAAFALAVKVAFVVPAAALALGSRHWRRYLVGLASVGLALGALSLAIFGQPLVDQVVTAQRQVGANSLEFIWFLLRQAGWNLLPFALPAYAAWRFRAQAHDPDLLRAMGALALGGLALFATVVKYGAYINLAVVVEPPLLVLAVAGAAWAWDARARLRPVASAVAVAGIALAGLGLAQAASLLVAPGSPVVFARPGAPSDLGWTASPDAVDRELARIARCPAASAYSGPSYFAFLGDRRMPGDQGDTFIVSEAEINGPFRNRALNDQPRCP
jgi:hypothetical protein